MLGLKDPINSERDNLDWVALVCFTIYIFVHFILEILVVQVHLVGAFDAGNILVHEIFILGNL